MAIIKEDDGEIGYGYFNSNGWEVHRRGFNNEQIKHA